eukprot:SAG31_NODE_7566_length_1652_cov_1.643915_1_plen_305_part_00
MSEAVDNAALMLICVSLAYKESANCRLEANYGHQQEVEMIPLMMEHGYRPTGWLGLILGTRLWYPFYPEAVETDAAFMRQIEATVREIGDRGKPKVSVARVQSKSAAALIPSQVAAHAPAPSPASAPTMAPGAPQSVTSAEQSISPNVKTRSVNTQNHDVEQSHLLERLLERVIEQNAKSCMDMEAKLAKQDHQLQKLQADLLQSKLREQTLEAQLREHALEFKLRDLQLAVLQARIESLHGQQLIADEDLHAIEDAIADNEPGGDEDDRVAKLVALSMKMPSDRAFARQLQRKTDVGVATLLL